ncbi:hypothetical protein [Pseudoalteromonas nigrifaciens]|uniref:hypothetical protein n=1 Tax=Pseudoalteromonas nigrifaciens TaxID=28109 RepID=UPI003FD5CDA4
MNNTYCNNCEAKLTAGDYSHAIHKLDSNTDLPLHEITHLIAENKIECIVCDMAHKPRAIDNNLIAQPPVNV